jgi:hypothetical protein
VFTYVVDGFGSQPLYAGAVGKPGSVESPTATSAMQNAALVFEDREQEHEQESGTV